MKINNTTIPDCYIIQPSLFEDERGYFFESFNTKHLENHIPHLSTFVQDNEAFSKEVGVIRGLHGQAGDAAQAKIVRVVKGSVLDVVLDIRKDSPSFGKHLAIELSEHNKTQLLIPRGCLHGYIVLGPDTIFVYKCDNHYNKAAEIGVSVKDATLGIDWRIPQEQWIMSEKDMQLPDFETFCKNL